MPRLSARCWGDRCVAEEKVRHCDHLLGLAAVLSPGQSELRGNLLYHKSGALRHLLETGPSTKAEVTLGVASSTIHRPQISCSASLDRRVLHYYWIIMGG